MSENPGRTPRVFHAEPTVIRAGAATAYRWGDAASGFVDDEVLVSSQLLHSIIFSLAPGKGFEHSRDNPTIFRADVVYTVLSGGLLVMDPERGQVVRAQQGDSIFFRRDTWHDGANQGTEPARVLEFFSPPPATGSSSAYARKQPFLEAARHADDSVLGRWPEGAATLEANRRLKLIQPRDRLLRLEGDLLVGLIVSTEHLTAAGAELPPGGSSSERRYGGEACLVLTAGALTVGAVHADTASEHRLEVGDVFVAPAETAVRYGNDGDEPANFLLGVAPSYLDPTQRG